MENMQEFAPVLVSVYHRLYTLKRCVAALRSNPEASQTDLYIVSDAPGRPQDVARVEAVRTYIKTIDGFKSVNPILREVNYGASRSCREAATELRNKYGRLIFLEDDIEVSTYFLGYMNAALDYYADDPQVYAVCGYKSRFHLPKDYRHGAYMLNRFSPWGYGSWASKYLRSTAEELNRYEVLKSNYPDRFAWLAQNDPQMLRILKADSEGELKAGDVRNEFEIITRDLRCVYPRRTMTRVMASGEDAVHATMKWVADERLSTKPITEFTGVPKEVDDRIYRAFLDAKYPRLLKRLLFSISSNGLVPTLKYYLRRCLGQNSGMHSDKAQ